VAIDFPLNTQRTKNLRKIYLSLTGGLGNQLFQVSAALSLASGDEVLVEWINSRPRLNANGIPEIFDFKLPENVILASSHKFHLLSSKSVGYVLRMGVNPRSYERSRLFSSAVTLLASILNIATLRKFVRIRLNKGVGYCSALVESNRNSFHLVGYFQTYKWLSELKLPLGLQQMPLQESSTLLLQFVTLAKSEEPLIVHMRFGDYRLEESFGLLTKKYYHESVMELWSSGDYKSIWVFSDEIDEAKRYFSELDLSEVRFISDIANSSAQTLEAMRLGKGYVIANSSFSWWAAKLSHSSDARVIAPTPWFIGQEEPVDLIPPEWIRRKGHE